MSKLKLAGLQDDTPVKLTIELPAEVHRDLLRYAEILSTESEAVFAAPQLVAPMLRRFMATDRRFVAARSAD